MINKSDKLPELNVSKMFAKSSNPSVIGLENSENGNPILVLNPNEAEFGKRTIRRKITRERSDIIKRLSWDLDNNTFQKSPSTFGKDRKDPECVSR
jgi:hypothetical protein